MIWHTRLPDLSESWHIRENLPTIRYKYISKLLFVFLKFFDLVVKQNKKQSQALKTGASFKPYVFNARLIIEL